MGLKTMLAKVNTLNSLPFLKMNPKLYFYFHVHFIVLLIDRRSNTIMSDRCPNNKHVTHDCNCITTSIDQWFKGYSIAYIWVTALWSRVFNDST